MAADFLAYGKSVHAGHIDVQQHKIRMASRLFQCCFAIIRRIDHKALHFKIAFQHINDAFFIIHDE